MDEVYIGAAHLTYGIINRLWEIAAAAAPTPTEGEASVLLLLSPRCCGARVECIMD